ncbi:MAG: hypothetical protein IJG68_04235 [Bacilli bacterium]|nr:hypothetical protein [Bacilli bacterium]
MVNKKIANIVFYKFFGSTDPEKKACIFYEDGTFENVSFSEGIDACERIVKEKNIKTKDAFREMINNNLVHVVSGTYFENNFKKYFPIQENEEETKSNIVNEDITNVEEPKKEEKVNTIVYPVEKEEKTSTDKASENSDEDVVDDKDEVEYYDQSEEEITKNKKQKGFFARAWDKIKNNKIVKKVVVCATALAVGLGLYSCTNRKSLEGRMNRSNLTTISDQNSEDNKRGLLGLFRRNKAQANTNENNNSNNAENNSPLLRDSNDYYDNYTFEQLQEVTLNNFQKEAMKNLHDALYGYNDTFASAHLEPGKDIRAALKFDEVVALQTAYNDYNVKQIRAYFNGAEINARDLSRAYRDAVLQLMGAHVIETKEHPVDMSMLIDSQEGKDFYNKYHKVFLEAKTLEGDAQLAKVKEFYDMLRADFKLDKKYRTTGISHSELYSDLESYMLSIVPMVAAGEIMWNGLKVDYTLNDEETEIFNNIGLCNYADSIFRRIEEALMCAEECDKNPLYEQYRNAMIKDLKERGIYYIDDAHRDLSQLDEFQRLVNKRRKKYGYYGSGYWATITTSEVIDVRTETETTYRTEETRTEKEITEEAKAEVDAQIEEENQKAKEEAEKEAQKVAEEMQKQEDENAAKIEEEIKQEEADLQQKIDEANHTIENNNKDQNPSNDTPVNESDFGSHNVDFFEEYSDSNGNLDSSVENITTDPTGDMTNQPLPDPNQTGAIFDQNAPAYQAPVEPVEPVEFYDVPSADTSVEIQAENPVTSVSDSVITEDSPIFFDVPSTDYTVENPVTSAPAAAPEPVVEAPAPVAAPEPVVEAPAQSYTEASGDGWIEYTPVSEGTQVDTYWVEEDPVEVSNAEIVDSYVESLAAEVASYEDSYQYVK